MVEEDYIGVRVSRELKHMVKQKALKEGTTISDMVRRLLQREVVEDALDEVRKKTLEKLEVC